MNELRTMHLFAGIGGGLLADLILGHRPIVAVEWDKYACRVLRERAADGWFPELSVWEGDVMLFDPSEYSGSVDCIHAGFPCQDISVAGKQAGLGEGTRSGLYREVLRIAGVVRPRYLFLENVSAILSNGLGCVLGDLAAMGYDCRWLCIRASDVGAPHHRDRWWCLATLADTECKPSTVGRDDSTNEGESGCGRNISGRSGINDSGLLNAEKNARVVRNTEHDGQPTTEIAGSPAQGIDSNQTGTQQAEQPARSGGQHAYVAYSQRDRLQGQRKDWSIKGQTGLCNREGRDEEQGVLRDTNSGRRDEGAERKVQGWENTNPSRDCSIHWWKTESQVGRLAHGIPDRVGMLKGLGNAQVPLQAAAAWRILISGGLKL